ncbi:hypothetical protein BKA70DRAFT_1314488 [Coprinopsis sp. MPI-PUGE-AT-0042]|nr:hypothetical protein BKA70DRAFT_1314488 [Coprinopsis sp. MPI-PUGE-AT-0042]
MRSWRRGVVLEVSLPDLAEGVIPFETPESTSPFLPQPTNNAQLEDPQPPASPFESLDENLNNSNHTPMDDSTPIGIDPRHPSTQHQHPSQGHPAENTMTQHLYTSSVLEPRQSAVMMVDMDMDLDNMYTAGGLDHPPLPHHPQRQSQQPRRGGFQAQAQLAAAAGRQLRLVLPQTPRKGQRGDQGQGQQEQQHRQHSLRSQQSSSPHSSGSVASRASMESGFGQVVASPPLPSETSSTPHSASVTNAYLHFRGLAPTRGMEGTAGGGMSMMNTNMQEHEAEGENTTTTMTTGQNFHHHQDHHEGGMLRHHQPHENGINSESTVQDHLSSGMMMMTNGAGHSEVPEMGEGGRLSEPIHHPSTMTTRMEETTRSISNHLPSSPSTNSTLATSSSSSPRRVNQARDRPRDLDGQLQALSRSQQQRARGLGHDLGHHTRPYLEGLPPADHPPAQDHSNHHLPRRVSSHPTLGNGLSRDLTGRTMGLGMLSLDVSMEHYGAHPQPASVVGYFPPHMNDQAYHQHHQGMNDQGHPQHPGTTISQQVPQDLARHPDDLDRATSMEANQGPSPDDSQMMGYFYQAHPGLEEVYRESSRQPEEATLRERSSEFQQHQEGEQAGGRGRGQSEDRASLAGRTPPLQVQPPAHTPAPILPLHPPQVLGSAADNSDTRRRRHPVRPQVHTPSSIPQHPQPMSAPSSTGAEALPAPRPHQGSGSSRPLRRSASSIAILPRPATSMSMGTLRSPTERERSAVGPLRGRGRGQGQHQGGIRGQASNGMLRMSRGGGKKAGVHHPQMMYSSEMRMQQRAQYQQEQQQYTAQSPSGEGQVYHHQQAGTPVTPLGMEGRDYMEARRNSEPANALGVVTSPMPLGTVGPIQGMEGIGYPPLLQQQEVYMHPDGFLHPPQQQQQQQLLSPLHHPELSNENQNEQHYFLSANGDPPMTPMTPDTGGMDEGVFMRQQQQHMFQPQGTLPPSQHQVHHLQAQSPRAVQHLTFSDVFAGMEAHDMVLRHPRNQFQGEEGGQDHHHLHHHQLQQQHHAQRSSQDHPHLADQVQPHMYLDVSMEDMDLDHPVGAHLHLGTQLHPQQQQHNPHLDLEHPVHHLEHARHRSQHHLPPQHQQRRALHPQSPLELGSDGSGGSVQGYELHQQGMRSPFEAQATFEQQQPMGMEQMAVMQQQQMQAQHQEQHPHRWMHHPAVKFEPSLLSPSLLQ